MKVFEARQIREIDEYTISHEPIASVDLMERAAQACTAWLTAHLLPHAQVRIFAGPGNNGGDGLAIARLLAGHGSTNIKVYLLQINKIISPDSEINRNRLLAQNKVPVVEISSPNDFPVLQQHDVIIDALFGTGISRPLEGLSAMLVNHICSFSTMNIAIDVPSGLQLDVVSVNHDHAIFRAHHTLTFEFPKRAFFFSENAVFTGEWHIVPIRLHPAIIAELPAAVHYVVHADIQHFFKKRHKFSNKGTYGHALLVAGSYGMAGAAILAARASLRSGIGLLTTHIPSGVYPIVQTAVPESIYETDADEHLFTGAIVNDRYTAIGIGPGIGRHPKTVIALTELLKKMTVPLVLDADALNIISEHPDMLEWLPPDTVLTPHPGEFDRLAGKSDNGAQRNMRQVEFARAHNVIVLLKGAFSSLALPDGTCHFNSTGNPGMATAGSGDVLTGIILSLLAQGYSPAQAAMAGMFIHGLAGDLAASETGQQSLIASDIIEFLGKAFLKFENYETYI